MEKLWNRNYLLIFSINFLTTIIFFLLIVSIGDYALRSFNASTAVAGLISSIFLIGAILGRILSGQFVNTFGAKKVLHISLFIFIIAITMYFYDTSILILLLTRFIHGVSIGLIGTAAFTLLLLTTAEHNRANAISYFSLSNTLAMAIGPFIGVYISIVLDSYSLLMTFNFVFSIICLLFYYGIKAENTKFSQEKTTKRFKLSDIISLNSPNLIIILFLTSFAYSGVLAYLTIYVQEIDLLTAGGYFFICYALANFIVRPVLMKYLQRNKIKQIFISLILLYAIGMLLLSQASVSMTLLFAAFLMGLGHGGLIIFIQIQMVNLAKPSEFSVVTSTFFVFLNLGAGFGPYLLGLIEPFTGYRILFLLMVPIICLTLLIYQFKFKTSMEEGITN